MANSYSYMNDDEIDDELKCAVCQQPFLEPVSSTRCHHTFCKQCIIACLDRERRCPMCRAHSDHEYYQPVGSRALMNQLNRLLVRCNACQMRNIQRGDFQSHTQNCPNWIVPCTAADIRCAWQGMRNQLATHLKSCSFQGIRPIIDDLRGQIKDLQQKQFFIIIGIVLIFVAILFLSLQKEREEPHNYFRTSSSSSEDEYNSDDSAHKDENAATAANKTQPAAVLLATTVNPAVRTAAASTTPVVLSTDNEWTKPNFRKIT